MRPYLLISFIAYLHAHIQMKSPAPRRSTFNKLYPGEPDYDMSSPIILSQFPCKGYSAGPIVNSYNAGDSISVELYGTATHNGGHCQFSLSYDQGKTFIVIHNVMDECLRSAGYNYQIPIPANAPASKSVTFAWTWINRTGNREFYMNCADIEIRNNRKGSYTGKKMLIANLEGYPTIPEFPTAGSYCGKDLYDNCENVTVNANGVNYINSNNNTINYNNQYNNRHAQPTTKGIAPHAYQSIINNHPNHGSSDNYNSKLLNYQTTFNNQVQQLNQQYNQGIINQAQFSNTLNQLTNKFNNDCLTLKKHY